MVASMGELQDELRKRAVRDRACLVVLAGANVGEMYRIEAGETVLGRATGATIRLNDDGISRRHARIFVEEGQFLIEDLNSANGTVINGQTMARTRLADGDKIRLGPTTILKFGFTDDIEESFQQRMYEAALRDGLTKAFNKKFFLDRLDTELAYARRHSADLSLLLFDVDHFKRINDRYGHEAGDLALQHVAERLRSACGANALLGRQGGEEFVVLLKLASAEQVRAAAETLREAVQAIPFAQGGEALRVTVSIGVALLQAQDRSLDDLLRRADGALYAAKRGGRDRVEFAAVDGAAAAGAG